MMHDHVTSPNGKMGFGLMRYGAAPVVVVIDRSQAGNNLRELTGIDCDAPIVGSVREALAYRPDTLIPAIAPAGGVLPADWMPEVKEGLNAGLSLLNGLHRPLERDPEFAPLVKPGRFIWDVRQEPRGLDNGTGASKDVSAKRVLIVGTDMAIGKMTVALELDNLAKERGLRSKFIATGQIGIAIAGEGIAVDGVKIDYASGAIEGMVLKHGNSHDILFVEGQGSVLHPASSATLPLLRGSMPTHMILAHRAGQTSISRSAWVPIPPLNQVSKLYEDLAHACGALPPAKVVGIALNTYGLSDEEAKQAVDLTAQETGLPTTDVIRFGSAPLLDAIMANP
jgi:uncharacterized NAD-dependent epimerase/dehydratase family protein